MIRLLSIAAMISGLIAVPLGRDESHAEPIHVSSAQAKALPRVERLADLLDLRLRPMPLVPPAQPGQRLGHFEVELSLPMGKWIEWKRWELRTGVRLAYENRPRDGIWQVEGMPTVGIGLRF
jgi:hypothetical protein